MITLYDVVGARPDDDAESLKIAFRRAVKKSHPDLHPDEPNALPHFRQVVLAKAILSDPDQRAIYDQMLEFERWRRRPRTKIGIVWDTLRNFASDAIIVSVLAVVLSGGYLTYVHLSRAPVVAVVTVKTKASDAPLTLPPSRPESQTVRLSREMVHELITGPGPASVEPSVVQRARNDASPALDAKAELTAPEATVSAAKDETITSSVARAQSHQPMIASAAPPAGAMDKDEADARSREMPERGLVREPSPGELSTRDGRFETGDAKNNNARPGEPETGNHEIEASSSVDPKFYRERGIISYRNGDLDRALADFNTAIRLDPKSAGAYIDRSMVLYRKAEFQRAFADMAQASRIQESLEASPERRRPNAQCIDARDIGCGTRLPTSRGAP